MAVVKIVITDDGEDSVNVKMEADPPVPFRDIDSATLAHLMGVAAMNAMTEDGDVDILEAS